jgi:hypothetical protein
MAEFNAFPGAERWATEPGNQRWFALPDPRSDIWRVPQAAVLLIDEAGNFIVTDSGEFLEVV